MSTINITSPLLHCDGRAEWGNREVIAGDEAAGNAFYKSILDILVMEACKKQTYENEFIHSNFWENIKPNIISKI